MISLSDITMTYGDQTVLGPVSLDIPAGGVTALVGPNGAGKSTLLTIVGRLTAPTSGRARVGGHDVATTPGRTLARVVSILRQENHFVTRLTVRELVGYRQRARPVPEAARIALKRMMRRLKFGNAGEMRAQHAVIFGAPCGIAGAVGGIGGEQMDNSELEPVQREPVGGIEDARRVAEGDDIVRP